MSQAEPNEDLEQNATISYDSMHGGQRLASALVAFGINTLLVYFCAVRLSPWSVYHWFGWIAPILRIAVIIPATDWYLQHLELVTIIPAAIVGYINATRFLPLTIRSLIGSVRGNSVALWAWIIPSLVLAYKMFFYHSPSSVLYPASMSAIEYFFDIQKVMPTRENLFTSDPVRVLTQMTITAPFYSGIAYSLGAWASKHRLLTTLHGSQRVP